MATEQRESGFYWVKVDVDDAWQPAEWDADQEWWWVCGDAMPRTCTGVPGEIEVIGARLEVPI